MAWPHCMSRMLQAWQCPSVAPWCICAACPGCSRFGWVPWWHHGVPTPCLWDAPGSAMSLGGTAAWPLCTSWPLRAQHGILLCVRAEHPCPCRSSCCLGDSSVAGGTGPARGHMPGQPGAHWTSAAVGDPFHVPAAGARQLFNFPGAGGRGMESFPGPPGPRLGQPRASCSAPAGSVASPSPLPPCRGSLSCAMLPTAHRSPGASPAASPRNSPRNSPILFRKLMMNQSIRLQRRFTVAHPLW